MTTNVAAEVTVDARRDDRVLAPARWVAVAVIPVLASAFVILYGFPRRTEELWGWMVCPSMSGLVMGGGYLSGAYLFACVARSREWHRIGVGFAATTVFSSILLATTVLHWSRFNHDHVSFWAWIALYGATPFLLPVLWWRNRRTDPGSLSDVDVRVPRRLRVAVGVGGLVQLGLAGVMFGWPHLAAEVWPWELEVATSRSLSAFVAFPAVTWAWFLVDSRWSSFRVTQQTATLGLVLVALGVPRAWDEFLGGWQTSLYLVALAGAIAANVALHLVMDRRAAGDRAGPVPATPPAPAVSPL